MPTGPALITPAELAAALGVSEGSLDADRTAWLLALASDLVRDELDQRIDYVEDDVAVLFGSGTTVLLLPELPVVDVTAVRILAEGSSTNEDLELDFELSDVEVRLELGADGRTGILRRLNGVWPRRRLIQVTYSHGYPLGADPSVVPGSIRLAAARASARGYYTTDGIRQETIGRYSVTYAAEAGVILTDVDKSGLARYYKGTRAGAR